VEIEFEGRYDKATLFKAVALANKPSRRGTILRVGFTIAFAVIYIAYFAMIASKESLTSFDIVRSGRHLITLLIIVYFLLQPHISSYFIASRLWKLPSMREPLTGTVSDYGIAYSSAKARRDIAWESFAKVRKTEDLIVLLTADGTLSLFPRGFFKNDDDWRKLLQWADYKVVEAK
jgi:hypothetical protein